MKALDEIRARLNAATPGPWAHWYEAGDIEVYAGDAENHGPVIAASVRPNGGFRQEPYANGAEHDAELIANAPTDLDQMERALRGVMVVHDWTMHCGNPRHTRMDATCDQCEAVCTACGEAYPCPTVTTIQEALG